MGRTVRADRVVEEHAQGCLRLGVEVEVRGAPPERMLHALRTRYCHRLISNPINIYHSAVLRILGGTRCGQTSTPG